jgi:hypothetical protein
MCLRFCSSYKKDSWHWLLPVKSPYEASASNRLEKRACMCLRFLTLPVSSPTYTFLILILIVLTPSTIVHPAVCTCSISHTSGFPLTIWDRSLTALVHPAGEKLQSSLPSRRPRRQPLRPREIHFRWQSLGRPPLFEVIPIIRERERKTVMSFFCSHTRQFELILKNFTNSHDSSDASARGGASDDDSRPCFPSSAHMVLSEAKRRPPIPVLWWRHMAEVVADAA